MACQRHPYPPSLKLNCDNTNLSQVTKKKSQENGPCFLILHFHLWVLFPQILGFLTYCCLIFAQRRPFSSTCLYSAINILQRYCCLLVTVFWIFFFLQKEINIHKAHAYLHTTRTPSHKYLLYLLQHLCYVFLDEMKCIHYLTVQSVVWISGEKFQA